MPEYELTANRPLAGFRKAFDELRLESPETLGLISVAPPLGGEQVLADALSSSYSCSWPATGQSSQSNVDGMALLGLARDQAFLLFDESKTTAKSISATIGDSAYLTDQSDSWAMLKIAGQLTHSVLERTCPVDLDETAFSVGAVTRTQMEHLAVIVFREAPDEFLLLSPASSASSFLHMIQTSVRNVF